MFAFKLRALEIVAAKFVLFEYLAPRRGKEDRAIAADRFGQFSLCGQVAQFDQARKGIDQPAVEEHRPAQAGCLFQILSRQRCGALEEAEHILPWLGATRPDQAQAGLGDNVETSRRECGQQARLAAPGTAGDSEKATFHGISETCSDTQASKDAGVARAYGTVNDLHIGGNLQAIRQAERVEIFDTLFILQCQALVERPDQPVGQ